MINIIVAIGKNNLIGKGNDLPWNYPSDLKYFKEITLGNTVAMGENTFYSIISRRGTPLPKRKNVVATLNKNFQYAGVEVTYDFINYLKENENTEEDIFIIGGKQIYALALPYAKRLYITHIDADYTGDVFFPHIDYSKYTLVSSKKENELDFCIYERK